MLARGIGRPLHEQRMRSRQRMERHGRRQVVQQVVTVVMRVKHFAEHAAERMVAAEPDQASGVSPTWSEISRNAVIA